MTPISNRGVGYAATSLRDRAHLLHSLASTVRALGSAAPVLGYATSAEIALDARLRSLESDLTETADALLRAVATIAPGEAIRERIAREGMTLPLTALLGGSPWVLAQIANGAAGAVIRPLARTVLDHVTPTAPQHHRILSTSRRVGTVHPPRTLEDRVSRIPDGDTHIRIERFGDRFEVYLSGTNFAGGPEDPWNAWSNIEFVRTGSAASVDAVTQSLASAGVTRHSPLTITGHSQGGLIALALAQSGDYSVEAVITAGTPAGIVGDTPGVPTIHLSHPSDPISALGGAASSTSTTWIVEPRVHGSALGAHHNSVYVTSARQLDELGDPEVNQLLAKARSNSVGLRSDVSATKASNQK